MINELLKRKIELLSEKPGCYEMKNSEGTIIYVGKAKSLVKRVKQYFTRPQTGKVQKMVSEIVDFDTIETETEKEALLLEISLIQKNYPKFNVLLKDGKMYPFIALKKQGDPFLKIAYRDTDKSFIYYGPFPNSGAAYTMMNLINKVFPLRKCHHLPAAPCLYYHLGQCLGPCINKISEVDYVKIVNEITKFLKGDQNSFKHEFTFKMKEASEKLDFEKAQEYKEIIDSIDHITANQKIMMKDHVDRDVIGYSTREGYLALMILMYRKGVLLGKEMFVIELEDDIDEQLSTLIYQFYLKHHKPKEIIISSKAIVDILNDALGLKVYLPTRGIKKELLMLAIENAHKGLDEHFMTARLEDNNLELLEKLGLILNIPVPLDIELFDNSHMQGSDAIGVMVKYINGVKTPGLYRKFKIKQENTRDDLASMHEVIYRRYYRLLSEKQKMPDLILVDGGKEQVMVAQNVVDSLNLKIAVASLYKNDKHQTDGLMSATTTFSLEHKDPLFFMLVRMQDEVHRYAITFHRSLHKKSIFTSIYEDIPLLGRERKRRMLNAYPSLELLKQATLEELIQIIPEESAQLLLKKINS